LTSASLQYFIAMRPRSWSTRNDRDSKYAVNPGTFAALFHKAIGDQGELLARIQPNRVYGPTAIVSVEE